MADHSPTADRDTPRPRAAPLVRRMTARDRAEEHRAATALELLFDLCFVVAVAQAGQRLSADLAEGRPGAAVTGYLYVFFGIWWAWMNFSWFASAYDTDDVPYRLLTLLQITGVLVYAAGVPRAFEHGDWTFTVVGYVIMRLALTTQWLRAARAETSASAKSAARRYAAGICLCQAGWIGMLSVPPADQRWLFLLLAAAELSVPPLAERGAPTAWHPRHIAERYGLFTMIVLGESVAAATVAVESGLDRAERLADVLPIAAGGLLIVFSAWWIYFAVPIHEHLASNRQAIPWGYGHYLVFGSAAAVGAGLEAAVEQSTGHSSASSTAAAAAVTVPTAVLLLTVWLLHSRHHKRGAAQQAELPITALLVLACTPTGHAAVPLTGAVCAASVAVGTLLAVRPQRSEP